MQNFTEIAAGKAELVWDDIRYFLELTRHGKLTATARVLGVEHSTVSRRVSALEKQLGIRLFDRLPKSWNLTEEGEKLLAYAHRIEEEALAFSRASMGIGALRGTVKISSPPVLASLFMVPRLAALRHRWPGITIEMIGEARQANLFRREADLAIRLSRPDEPGLTARLLAEMGYGLYAAARWLERQEQEWEFIGYEESLQEAPQQKWLEKISAGRPFIFRANDLAALYQACRAGLGLGVLPHYLARNDPALFAVSDHPYPTNRAIWLVIHPDVRRSPRVKLVADILSDLLREHAQDLV